MTVTLGTVLAMINDAEAALYRGDKLGARAGFYSARQCLSRVTLRPVCPEELAKVQRRMSDFLARFSIH